MNARSFRIRLFGLFLAPVLPFAAQGREAQWQQVREAMNAQLPRTAIEHLDPIIEGAVAERAWPEAIRAVALRARMGVGLVPGREPPVAMEPPPPVGTQVPPPADDPQVGPIVRLRAELDAAPEPMRPALQALLAHWTWQYFQNNRWRFAQRTQTDAPPGDDIRAWDLARILEEVDTRFTAALENEAALKAIPIETYDALLEKGTVPDAHRPTLFDFLAHEALTFYSAGEQGAVHAEDAFAIPAESPVFDEADAFLAWDPETADTGSPLVKAVRLYQRLLASHRQAPDPTAFIDADLERLRFGFNQAFGEDKDERYRAALERLADARQDHPLSADARHRWAEQLHAAGESVEARRIALIGRDRHPGTPGAARCAYIIGLIEAPHVAIRTERVWTDPMPTIDVSYRNVEEMHFRAIPYDFEALLRRSRGWSPDVDFSRPQERNQLLQTAPALAWSVRLPATADYRARMEALPAPDGLAPGFYIVAASPTQTFTTRRPIAFAPVWVSDMALVVRERPGLLDGFVLNARTGEPMAGATVQAWERNQGGGYRPESRTRTRADGRFRFDSALERGALLLAEHEGQRLSSTQPFHIHPAPVARDAMQTVLFTDRAIYRPGQTVYYKGIAVRADAAGETYEAIQQAPVNVAFLDANHQAIASASHRTNDVGSFSGAFTAPRGRGTGTMTLRVTGGAPGQALIRVEEYRRPRFRVELDPPVEAPRLGEEIAVVGKAEAYTDAAIGGAPVRWRVERMTRFPPWRRWFFHTMPASETQAIAHGTAVTDADGTFPIRFIARPDPKVAEADDPVFRFRIVADVTDAAGETRTAERTVSVGYTALQATLSAADWLTPRVPVEIVVVTQSPDGEGRPAEGVVRIHPLRQPDRVLRPPLHGPGPYRAPWGEAPASADEADPSDPNTWELAPPVAERSFRTGEDGKVDLRGVSLPPGLYRAVLESQDRFGKPVTAQLPLHVIDPEAGRLEARLPNLLAAESWTVEPGSIFRAVWGTGYETGRAYVEIERAGETLQAFWTDPAHTQVRMEQAVDESMRGGFTLRTTFVRENRAYIEERTVEVPWSNQRLSIAWERFTSKLEPGGRETWTAVIRGPGAETAAAEMVAGLYDASLDAFVPHAWMQAFALFRREHGGVRSSPQNRMEGFRHLPGSPSWPSPSLAAAPCYRAFPAEILQAIPPVIMRRFAGRGGDSVMAVVENGRQAMLLSADANKGESLPDGEAPPADDEAPPPDLAQVTPRRILDETAFFFPHLASDADGTFRISFTVPEALTEWRFQAFAHDARLRSGYLEDRAVTAKDLMVEPNPPRFLREGDELAFTVKVTNRTGERQAGRLRLNFFDARTLDSLDTALANEVPEIAFDVPPMEARAYAWRIRVPDGAPTLIYRAVGATGTLSDGEEGYLPVLSRRIFVTESLPLSIRGPGRRAFDFERLRLSAESPTLRHQALTVQVASNPAWYAVLALPYLMEAPHRSSDRVFTQLYANAIARHIAASDPRIRRIFNQWRGTDALESPLEKNEDLKAVALEETPWLRQARSESEARRNVGILFDANRLEEETARALQELARMQLGDGHFPWFPGGRPSTHTTLGVVTGFGRLRNMGVGIDTALAVRALRPLDAWMAERHARIVPNEDPDRLFIDTMLAFYLYGRTFFIEDRAVGDEHREAFDYWLGQARRHWTRLPRQSQAHLALALHRLGDADTPGAILRSLKERASVDPDLGMHWIEPELSWWWYRSPIETQAMMIEAFDEVAGDREAVEDARVWLLTQKRTQHWRTTRATADAVYALLMRGTDLLASDAIVRLRLGGEPVRPAAIEPGTGFYEQRFGPGEVRPAQGRIEVEKTDEGLAWGGVHWQYLEDVDRITPYEGTPLTVRKRLYTRVTTERGPELRPMDGPVAIGDELIVRIELRADRDMEYIHLKDHRGSGTEPVEVLSRHRYQDGLGYFESTRDTATHFFIERLPRGVYVFEYAVRVRHAGRYPSGLATIQCLYAPEFNSHSESIPIEAR